MLKVALLGYGKMGKAIEKLADDYEASVCARVNNSSTYDLLQADVCIDFSHPDAVLESIKKYANQVKYWVIGTTGWERNLEEVVQLSHDHSLGLVYSSNFSSGMQLFFKLVSYAKTLLNNSYDVSIHELHHRYKVDAPSGTAKKLSEILGDVPVSSTRCGEIPGTHQVIIDSVDDTIELKHTARNRLMFARGALDAAQWVQGKTGIYRYEEVLFSCLEESSQH